MTVLGSQFGNLTLMAISATRAADSHIIGVWRCDCGQTKEIMISRVKSGVTKSCGCIVGKANLIHGMKGSPEYSSWGAMLGRCHNPNHKDYPRYGEKGISVCKEWRDSFVSFFEHIGPRPTGTTLDRIDGKCGYEPGNVRWATPQQQARNRKNSIRLFTPNGPMYLVDYAKIIGASEDATRLRFRRGKLAGCELAP